MSIWDKLGLGNKEIYHVGEEEVKARVLGRKEAEAKFAEEKKQRENTERLNKEVKEATDREAANKAQARQRKEDEERSKRDTSQESSRSFQDAMRELFAVGILVDLISLMRRGGEQARKKPRARDVDILEGVYTDVPEPKSRPILDPDTALPETKKPS